MSRIFVTGAGGTPAINFCRSLRAAPEEMYLIGVDCNKYYLQRAICNERYMVPRADDNNYLPVLANIIAETGAEFIHAQNDAEIGVLSEHRDELGVKFFLPKVETVRSCLDKFASHRCWVMADIIQPQTFIINDDDDLQNAFSLFEGPIWLRDRSGAAGRGSIAVRDIGVATAWLDFKQGWGHYTAAEYLSPHSVTWQSIWKDGKLVVAQSRRRLYWEFADRAPSGITGLTGAGMTCSNSKYDDLAQRAILAIDSSPHGIFSVDMTLDAQGEPNPTEINIGRFFTTHEFFTQLGLNMPYIYVKLAFDEYVDLPAKRINPLPAGQIWIRGMDLLPVLCGPSEVDRYAMVLKNRLHKLELAS